ncbi:EAL domain-containing protein [Halothiobacillus sp. DCM-1]|uniref:sensor domain-containing phosphodiesterase n=1 Tax=Halothiobacillus sp. DCM-1 TaxID=3112558 RepID=UPI003252D489
MSDLSPDLVSPEVSPAGRWGRASLVAALWIVLALLTDALFPGGATDQVVGLWPADAVALGFVLAWGARALVPLLFIVVLCWNHWMVDLSWGSALIGAGALALSLILMRQFRRWLQRHVQSIYGRRLLGLPLSALLMATLVTGMGIWQNPAWVENHDAIALFWMAEAVSLLVFTPLVLSCLHEKNCLRAWRTALRSRGAQDRATVLWFAGWLLLALLSLALMAALRHWTMLDYNAPGLLGLVVLILAVHSLPIQLVRPLIAAYVLVWVWLNAVIAMGTNEPVASTLGDEALVFVAAVLAVIATEMMQIYRQSEQRLAKRLATDGLTDLQNDEGLAQTLKHWPVTTGGQMQPMTVIGLHLPDLEEIDALMGHEESNRIEQRVAEVIRSVGFGQMAARVRPGLYILCLQAGQIGFRAADLARRIRLGIEAERQTFGAGSRYFRLALTVFNTAQTQDLGQLTSAVLAGCQQALNQRSQLVHVEDDLAILLSHRMQELAWVQRIRSVLNGDEQTGRFELYAQTIRDTRHPDVKAFEVLLRWRNPDGAVLTPASFLPIAERYGLMTAIDSWVLRQTLRQLSVSPWAAEISKVSINLSGASLVDPNITLEIQQALERTGCRAEQICFEITETMVINDVAQARQAVVAIKELGCKISLDDFGTGLSTFSYLKRFPFDYLKIDGEFVQHIVESRIDRAIVESIQSIAFEMSTITIAEFVETLDQAEILRQIGVFYHQGYGVAKPRPLSQFLIP